jgi:hypothetical protein
MWWHWIKSVVIVMAVMVFILSIKIILVVPQEQQQASFSFSDKQGMLQGELTSSQWNHRDSSFWNQATEINVTLPHMQRPQ